MRTTPSMPIEGRQRERRAVPRHNVLFRTVLIDSEIDGEAAEITNIGQSGFLARTSLRREKGHSVSLDAPALGQIRATVVWCGNGLLGAHFHEAITDAAFSELLGSLT